MKKPLLSLFSLCILTALSPFLFAAEMQPPQIDLAQEKAQWLQAENQATVERIAQRELFLQAENLLRSAVKNNQFSTKTEKNVQSLIEKLAGYPLQNDLRLRFWESKMKLFDESDSKALAQAEEALNALILQSPPFIKSNLQTLQLDLLLKQQKWQAAVDLAKTVKPSKLADQIKVLSAQYELDIAKLFPENSPHTLEKWAGSETFRTFEKLWQENDQLPANPVQQEWESLDGMSAEKVRSKIQVLFEKNEAKGLAIFAASLKDETLKTQALSAQQLAEQPDQLPNVALQADTLLTKPMIIAAFPRYLKTLPEQQAQPNFDLYQQWAQHWQLSDSEIKQWKIAFISRFFDNTDPNFQQWRDAQIAQLQADNLTERRLRMAIWQKTPLRPWLNALSSEGKAKQEWQYWAAKNDPQKMQEKLTALSRERGFYPMLASAQLKQPYQVNFPVSPVLSQADLSQFKPALERIAELRQLGRFGLAKQAWRALLINGSTDRQRALSHYAQSQQWFDLAVDGTIIAKAWADIPLRLPNAYAHYFETALADSPIQHSFAMAIARQESAWNPQAQSGANARGLMQLLPSTAKLTAENQQIPYTGENDLFKPLNNILLGTAHLAELNEKYPNNRILIAAAYNAGASRVERWLARADGKLQLDEFIASIPFYETRGYVQNVVAYDFYYQHLLKQENPQIFSQAEWDRLY